MKYLQAYSVALIAALGIGLSLGFAEKTSAGYPRCRGASCNDKNPTEYQCNEDAVVEVELITSVYRWQDAEQPQQITIQKMYSESCQANWTRAYIPNETYLFVRERNWVNGEQPTNGLVYATGAGYFWAEGNMSRSNVSNQSCVSLSTGVWFWYDRHCTIFN